MKRRETITVDVGGVKLGSEWPVRVQSMTNTDTNDIERSAAQCQRIADAGGELVRLTAQGVREAEGIGMVRNLLRKQGCNVPLVADIHFNPRAAFAAAALCEKVRINPGNFVDPARTFKSLEYTDEEYQAELQKIHDTLLPFIQICRDHHTAVRLGVNHGSLSDRIMSRYGNTPAGMVESVMEFLRVFVDEGFMDVVISMKASNVVVMIEAVRRLVHAMDQEDMHFPLHLGVTEAGFGEDGRVKSAVGIGTLMNEGLGDTIRVSLSEDPELEIPVAQKLVHYITARTECEPIEYNLCTGYDPICPPRREPRELGGKRTPLVVASCDRDTLKGSPQPDFTDDELVDVLEQVMIITPDNEDFIQLADSIKKFRTEQGIPTEIFTVSQCGGNDQTAIRNFIRNAYNTWDMPPAAVLLLGDHNTDGTQGIVSYTMNNHPGGDSYNPYISDVPHDQKRPRL